MKFTLPEISDYRRRQLTHRAAGLLQAHQQIHQQHGGPHNFMLAHSLHEDDAPFTAMRHYPKGDRIDYASGGQYFYHCHREDMDTEEHGHFHVFVRKSGWPKSYRLPQIPERDKYMKAPMTHVISISLNRYGQPIRLFTVNRWISHECWFEAERLGRLSQKFSVQPKKNPEWQVMDIWVENFIHLFMPQILWLQQERDKTIAKVKSADPYHDETVEELSSLPIDLQKQVQWIM